MYCNACNVIHGISIISTRVGIARRERGRGGSAEGRGQEVGKGGDWKGRREGGGERCREGSKGESEEGGE